MIPSLPPLPAPSPPARPDPDRSGPDRDADPPFELGEEPVPEPAATGGPASASAASSAALPPAAEPPITTPPPFGPSLGPTSVDATPASLSAALLPPAPTPPSPSSDPVAGSAAPEAAEGAARAAAGSEGRQSPRADPAAQSLRPEAKAATTVARDDVKLQPAAASASVLAATPGLAAALRAAMPDAPGGGPKTDVSPTDGLPTPGPAVADAPEDIGPARPGIAPDAASMRMALDAATGATVGAAPTVREALPAAARADAPAPAAQPTPPPAAPAAVTAHPQMIELVMAPDELGALRVQVSGEGDAMRLTLAAERPDTLDLMRRHGDALLADLRQSGHGGAALAFGEWSGRAGSQAGGATADPDTPGEAADAARPAPVTARAASAGLDLRL